jgi:hypothetical protein
VQLCAAPRMHVIPSFKGMLTDLTTFGSSQIMRLLSFGGRSGCLSLGMAFCILR